MNCPACDCALCEERLHGQHVDRCTGCGGLWLSDGDLGPLIRRFESVEVRPAREAQPHLACPRCGDEMASIDYAHDSGVSINRCGACRGVWLEAGQLEQIVACRGISAAEESLAQAMALDLGRTNRWRRIRDLLRSRLLSGLVAGAYLLIAGLRGDGQTVFGLVGFLVFPIACIWWCDGMGRLTGVSFGAARPTVTQETPGDFVAIGGWLLLLCPAALMLASAW